jgi:hypothetical protein
LSAPANATYAISGLAVSNCSADGVHILAAHAGDATLTALNITGSGGAGGVGLLIDVPTTSPPGGLVIDACVFLNNTVNVSDPGAVITSAGGTTSIARKKTNNYGYNPLGVPAQQPTLTTSIVYNNSGVDQYVYIQGNPGSVRIDNQIAGSGPGTYLVPSGGTIQLSTLPTSWVWFGN